jgi:general secretion pathway protein N
MRLTRTHLTLVLGNGLLVAGLAWMYVERDQAEQWLPADKTSHASAPRVTAPVLADLSAEQREVAWQKPLFSADRQPDAIKPQASSQQLAGVRLSGVVVDGADCWALLRLADQRSLKLRLGDALDSGWVLKHVEATRVTFERQGQTHTLNLPVPRLPAPAPVSLITLPHVLAP